MHRLQQRKKLREPHENIKIIRKQTRKHENMKIRKHENNIIKIAYEKNTKTQKRKKTENPKKKRNSKKKRSTSHAHCGCGWIPDCIDPAPDGKEWPKQISPNSHYDDCT